MRGSWLGTMLTLWVGAIAAADGAGAQGTAAAAFSDCQGCPLMVPLPAGTFLMGAPAAEEKSEGVPPKFQGWAAPQHEVSLRSFALGRHEVTRAEFALFVRETGYDAGNECYVYERDPATRQWGYQERAGKSWRDPGFAQTEQDPVVCVSWNDAHAYAAWLSARSGKPYRLASEAEWEYAARAGTSGPRFWGSALDRACDYANVADASAADAMDWTLSGARAFLCTDGFANTAPADRFKPNPFGLHGMLGNANEWVEDCWNETYRGAPVDGSPWVSGDCGKRLARGGSWLSILWNVRAGGRGWVVTSYRGASTGFRVARGL